MNLENARLHERDQAVEIGYAEKRFSVMGVRSLQDVAVGAFELMLLEEAALADPGGAAQQRERTQDDMGRHEGPGQRVIVGQRLLGEAALRPQHAIGMRQCYVGLRGHRSRLRLCTRRGLLRRGR